jgi:phage-related protein
MGWFSDLWSGIKNTASNIWSGVKNVAGTVYDTVRKPVDWISKGLEYASKIPGLGTIIAPVRGVVDTVKSGLDQAKSVGDVVKAVGLKEGGMVQKIPAKYYQKDA